MYNKYITLLHDGYAHASLSVGAQHVCEEFLVRMTMTSYFKKLSFYRNGDLLIWVSDWSMVTWSMHGQCMFNACIAKHVAIDNVCNVQK